MKTSRQKPKAAYYSLERPPQRKEAKDTSDVAAESLPILVLDLGYNLDRRRAMLSDMCGEKCTPCWESWDNCAMSSPRPSKDAPANAAMRECNEIHQRSSIDRGLTRTWSNSTREKGQLRVAEELLMEKSMESTIIQRILQKIK